MGVLREEISLVGSPAGKHYELGTLNFPILEHFVHALPPEMLGALIPGSSRPPTTPLSLELRPNIPLPETPRISENSYVFSEDS